MANTYNMSDVFLSYSRKDSEFVHKLFNSLKEQGKEIWADFEDIPKAADWWKEIQAGIDAADTFVFVISPDSVRSDVCRQEVEHAISKNKRFIPLLHREITEAEDKAKVHPHISAHNWIFFRGNDSYDTALGTLSEALNTDLEHNQMLKKLLVRAMEWDAGQKNNSYALRGEDLQHAQTWLSTALAKTPPPTKLHMDYITFSQHLQQKQQRQRLAMLSAGLIGSMVLTVIAVILGLLAFEARNDAVVAQKEAYIARDQAQVSEKRAKAISLASGAVQALSTYKPDLAIALALEGAKVDDTSPQVISALAQTIYAPGTQRLFSIGVAGTDVEYVGNSNLVAVAGPNGYLCLVDPKTEEKTCLNDDAKEMDGQDKIDQISVDTSGTLLLASSSSGATLWNIDPASEHYEMPLHTYTCENADGSVCAVNTAELSADGAWVLVAHGAKIDVWDTVHDGIVKTIDLGEHAEVTRIVISDDKEFLLLLHTSGDVSYWLMDTGNLVRDIIIEELDDFVTSIALSPDHRMAALGMWMGDIRLFDFDAMDYAGTLTGNQEKITALAFSPDALNLYSSSQDSTFGRWQLDTQELIEWYTADTGGMSGFAMNADGRTFVTISPDTTVRLWHIGTALQGAYTNIHKTIWEFDFNATTNTLAVATDATVDTYTYDEATQAFVLDKESPIDGIPYANSLWKIGRDGKIIYVYDARAGALLGWDVAQNKSVWTVKDAEYKARSPEEMYLNPDNSILVVRFEDSYAWYDLNQHVKLGDVERDVTAIAFHPNDTDLLIGNSDGTIHLLMLATGEELHHYSDPGHRAGISSLAFNADGTKFASGGSDTDILVWDTETGKMLTTLIGHDNDVIQITFLSGDHYLMSASDDQSVRLWNLDTQSSLYRYGSIKSNVVGFAMLTDGTHFIKVHKDGQVAIRALPPSIEEMEATVNDLRYVRELTCFERRIYLDNTIDCSVLSDQASAAPEPTAAP